MSSATTVFPLSPRIFSVFSGVTRPTRANSLPFMIRSKAAALRGALSDRARNGRVHVVTGFGVDGLPSTKNAVTTHAKRAHASRLEYPATARCPRSSAMAGPARNTATDDAWKAEA